MVPILSLALLINLHYAVNTNLESLVEKLDFHMARESSWTSLGQREPETQKAQDNVGEPFLLFPEKGISSVPLVIKIHEVGEISYAMSARSDILYGDSAPNEPITGSFQFRMVGEVVESFNAEVLQGKKCYIDVGGPDTDQGCNLGYVRLHELAHDIEVNLGVKNSFANDLVAYMRLYKAKREVPFEINLRISNERRRNEYSGHSERPAPRIITFEIVEFRL